MLDLSLNRINSSSPYYVSEVGVDTFSFSTDYGVVYELGFIEDFMLDIDHLYQFFLMPKSGEANHKDEKILQTVYAVMEEFFHTGNLILDYVCDTHDGRQSARSRLFSFWYQRNPGKIGYTQRNIMAFYEGVGYYAAVLIRNDNPKYAECMKAIDDFAENIGDKLK